jgi:calcium load-activated calcium channel
MFEAWVLCSISLVTSLVSEALTYYFVYRKPHYQNLRTKIELAYYEVDDLKRSGGDEKKCKRIEREMKSDNTKLMGMRMYSMMFLGVSSFIMYQAMRKTYAGLIVAKLPFVPFDMLTKLSHSGIEGTDMTDCSFVSVIAFICDVQHVVVDVQRKPTPHTCHCHNLLIDFLTRLLFGLFVLCVAGILVCIDHDGF